jgi:GTP-binding protein Era
VAIDLLIQSLKKRKSKLTATPVQIYLILNKVDQLFSASSQEKAKGFLAEMRSAFLSQAAAASFDLEKQLTTFTISALAKTHTDELLKATRELLPESPFYYPDHEQLSDRHMRFFVAEKIREQCFKQLGDELPYSCGVEIDSFKEGTKLHRVEATIFVERDSQKPMIIGKGGLKIKSIGQEARIEIEKMMGQKLYLGLRVKVLKNWTQDQNLMKRFGYQT